MNDNFAKELEAVSIMTNMPQYKDLQAPKEYKIYVPPKPVGYWLLGGGGDFNTQFPFWVKPTPEQIENHKTMLGWEWRDA
jgi:hypothetical protein